MFGSQCVDYMALTRMSIVEAPQQLFEINLIQLSLRNLAHCSGMNFIDLSEYESCLRCSTVSCIFCHLHMPSQPPKMSLAKIYSLEVLLLLLLLQHAWSIHACYFCSEGGHWTLLISSARAESPMSRRTSTRVDQVTGCFPLPVSHSRRISVLICFGSFECL